ncbi:MAG: hypothetical protein SGPRY_002892 [Prymnesium sp.]
MLSSEARDHVIHLDVEEDEHAPRPSASKRLKRGGRLALRALTCDWWCAPLCGDLPFSLRSLLAVCLLESCLVASIIAQSLTEALSSWRDASRGVHFPSLLMGLLVVALWTFLLSSVRRENFFELAGANVLSALTCATPLYLLIKTSPSSPPSPSSNLTSPQQSSAAKLQLTLEQARGGTYVALGVVACVAGASFFLISFKANPPTAPLAHPKPQPQGPPPTSVAREFGWRTFLLYGDDPRRTALHRRLMIFWMLWKMDLFASLIVLLCTWAFLFQSWSVLAVFGLVATLCSSVSCSALLLAGVTQEISKLTLVASLLGCLQPVQLYLSSPTRYQDVPIASVFFSLSAACAVRLPLLLGALWVSRLVFGQGMKGKDPYERSISLPKEVQATLTAQQLEAVKRMVEGQMVHMNTLEEKDKSNPFTERDLSHEDDWDLDGRFLQLSSDLTTLRWSYNGYILVEQIIHVRRVHLGEKEKLAPRHPALRSPGGRSSPSARRSTQEFQLIGLQPSSCH